MWWVGVKRACSDMREQEIAPLWTLKKLKYLSLLDNPVTKKPQYRCDMTNARDIRRLTPLACQATSCCAVKRRLLLLVQAVRDQQV